MELEDVVEGADEGPFASDFVDPAHEELAEASGLLDLPEHRLDDLLSETVAAAPPAALETLAHGLDPRAAALLLSALGMLLAAGGDVAANTGR